ncbi:MAG: DUF4430 domain-containing protein [Patescibacteria group bacterium]|nr:DUF4430 domain-containing protein [Patescibacteria group bacterium]
MKIVKSVFVFIIVAVIGVASWQILNHSNKVPRAGKTADNATSSVLAQNSAQGASTENSVARNDESLSIVKESEPAPVDASNTAGLNLASKVQTSQATASIVIVSDATNTLVFELAVKQNETAFDLLKEAVSQAKLALQTKDYGQMGILVEAIGNRKNGQDGKYWMYYVNGEAAYVACDKQIIQAGDKVEFRFEKGKF